MATKQEKPWQYKFSFALSLVMLALVIGYFVQSFQEIRKVQPVRVAIERISAVTSVERTGLNGGNLAAIDQKVPRVGMD